ncbi:MAG: hypothetical protein K0U52_07030, partial [Gammaproteobacteria bacterium]|nr:hypothetical protein [Gammaproteobacteria bacterium]
ETEEMEDQDEHIQDYLVYPAIWWQQSWAQQLEPGTIQERTQAPDGYVYPVPPNRPQLKEGAFIPARQLRLHAEALESVQQLLESDDFNRQLDNLFLNKDNVTWDQLLEQIVQTWKSLATHPALNTRLSPGHVVDPVQCLDQETLNPQETKDRCDANDQCVYLSMTNRCIPNQTLEDTGERVEDVKLSVNDASDLAWLASKRRQLIRSSSQQIENQENQDDMNNHVTNTMKTIVNTLERQSHLDQTTLDVAHLKYIIRMLATVFAPVPKVLADRIFVKREDEQVDSNSTLGATLVMLMLLSANVLNTVGQMQSEAPRGDDMEEEMKQDPGEFAQAQVQKLFRQGLQVQDPSASMFDRPVPVEFLTKYMPHFFGRNVEIEQHIVEQVESFSMASEQMQTTSEAMMDSQDKWGQGPQQWNSQDKTDYLIQKEVIMKNVHSVMDALDTQVERFQFMVSWGMDGAESVMKDVTTVSKLALNAVLVAPERIGNRMMASVGQALHSISLYTGTHANNATLNATVNTGQLGGLSNNSYVYAEHQKDKSEQALENVHLVSTYLWLEAQRSIASNNLNVAYDSLDKLHNVIGANDLAKNEELWSNIKARCIKVQTWTTNADIHDKLNDLLDVLQNTPAFEQPMNIDVIPDSPQYAMMFGTFEPVAMSQERLINQILSIATLQQQILGQVDESFIKDMSTHLKRLELNPTTAIYGAFRNLFLTLANSNDGEPTTDDMQQVEQGWDQWKQQLVNAIDQVDNKRQVLQPLLETNLVYTRQWVMTQMSNRPQIDASWPGLVQLDPGFFQQVIESETPVGDWMDGEAEFFTRATQDLNRNNIELLIQDARSYHDIGPLLNALSGDSEWRKQVIQVGIQEIFQEVSTPIYEQLILETSHVKRTKMEERIMKVKTKEQQLFSNLYTNDPVDDIREDGPGFQVKQTPQVRSTAMPGIQLGHAIQADSAHNTTSVSVGPAPPHMSILDGGLGRVSVGQVFKGVALAKGRLDKGVFEVTVDGVRKLFSANVSNDAIAVARETNERFNESQMTVLKNQTYNIVADVANLDAYMDTYENMLETLGEAFEEPSPNVSYQTRGTTLLRFAVEDDAVIVLEVPIEDVPEHEKANAAQAVTNGLQSAQGQKDMYLSRQQVENQQLVQKAAQEAQGQSRRVPLNDQVKYKLNGTHLTRIQVHQEDDELEVVDIEDFDEWTVGDIPQDETYKVQQIIKDRGPETIVIESDPLTAEEFKRYQEKWYQVEGVTPDLEYVGFSESELNLKDSLGNPIFSFVVEGGAAIATMANNQPLQMATLGMSKPVQRVMHKVGLESWRPGGRMGKPRDLRRVADGRGFHMKVKGMERAIDASLFTYWDNTLKSIESADSFIELVNKMWEDGLTLESMGMAFTEGVIPGYIAYRAYNQWLPFLDLTAQGLYAPKSGMLQPELMALTQVARFMGPTGMLVANAAALGFQMYGHIDFALRLYEDPWGTLQKYQDLLSKLQDWHQDDLQQMGIDVEREVQTWEMFQDNVLASRVKAENIDLESNIEILENKLAEFDRVERLNEDTINQLKTQGVEVDQGFVDRWMEQQTLERQRAEDALAQFREAQGLGEMAQTQKEQQPMFFQPLA